MKFRVVAGTHYEGGKRFTKGQVVTSTQDLHKLFTGKFEKVAETVESSKGSSNPPPPPGKKSAAKTKPVVEEDDE